jgi:hypothetical protein
MQAKITSPIVKPRIKANELLEFPFVESFEALGDDVGSKKPAEDKLIQLLAN